jgi:large subunit ribosomal protein L25
MKRFTLEAQKRLETGRKAKKLQVEGMLPATLYGKNIKSENIKVKSSSFLEVWTKAGETGLIDIILEGKTRPVLIKNLQIHPVTRRAQHAEFQQVDLKETIKAMIPLAIEGESEAEKSKIGVIIQVLNEIEVEALPTDLPDKISINVEGLKEINDSLSVTDLVIPENVKILSDLSQQVVRINAIHVEEEAPKVETEESVDTSQTEETETTEGEKKEDASEE